MSRDYLVNSFDLSVRRSGLPYLSGASIEWTIYCPDSSAEHGYRVIRGDQSTDWTEMADQLREMTGVQQLVRDTNWGDWWPVTISEHIATGEKWGDPESDRTRKIRFVPGEIACGIWQTSAGGWSSHRCGRIATEAAIYNDFGIAGPGAPICAMHYKAQLKRKAGADEREERREAEQQQRDRDDETSRMIAETLERIRPLLGQLGIHPDTVVAGEARRDHRLGILLPAEAVELLVGQSIEAVELREIMEGGG